MNGRAGGRTDGRGKGNLKTHSRDDPQHMFWILKLHRWIMLANLSFDAKMFVFELKNVGKCTGEPRMRKEKPKQHEKLRSMFRNENKKTPSQFIVSPLDCANFGKGRRRSLSARYFYILIIFFLARSHVPRIASLLRALLIFVGSAASVQSTMQFIAVERWEDSRGGRKDETIN